MNEKLHINNSSYIEYPVWSASLRLFHWINVLLITLLAVFGAVILFSKSLGISNDGKLLIKTIHACVGYLFLINLFWRIIMGFNDNYFPKWKTILDFRKGYYQELTSYLKGLCYKNTTRYLGHNPVAKIIIVLLYILLITQGSTGLVLAGTDLYLPPFGHEIKKYIAGPGKNQNMLKNIKPGSSEGIDNISYEKMRTLREFFVELHESVFYFTLVLVLIHTFGVVVTEIREKNAIVSAMITGRKYFNIRPADYND